MPTVLESINQGLHGAMAANARVVVLGEDILDPYGGAFKVTRGLSSAYPDRVFTTPISEAAIVGLASGLALRGMRPITEIMFGDFLFLAGDQLANHAAKFQWMYNDQVSVPMVVRTPMGARRGYGPTHSQSIEKHFMGIPGLWVVAPHILGEPGRLLRQATLECDAPVVFIESKTCYGRALVSAVPGMTSTVIADEASPFPTVVLRHDRSDVADGLLWCYGGMTPHCLEAVQHLKDREGLHLDLAVVSQLSPVPASHIERIVADCETELFVYAEEASVEHGWSAEVLAQVQQQLSAAGRPGGHVRIGGAHTPIASSRTLEAAALPQASDIVAGIVDCF
ncbi:MAG: transketolase C-terminal domain-containing protein [Acidobacteriota bacterium]|nr:transketolase C-terminal domain-containing protein [Acidobacteriota bacterium]